MSIHVLEAGKRVLSHHNRVVWCHTAPYIHHLYRHYLRLPSPAALDWRRMLPSPWATSPMAIPSTVFTEKHCWSVIFVSFARTNCDYQSPS